MTPLVYLWVCLHWLTTQAEKKARRARVREDGVLLALHLAGIHFPEAAPAVRPLVRSTWLNDELRIVAWRQVVKDYAYTCPQHVLEAVEAHHKTPQNVLDTIRDVYSDLKLIPQSLTASLGTLQDALNAQDADKVYALVSAQRDDFKFDHNVMCLFIRKGHLDGIRYLLPAFSTSYVREMLIVEAIYTKRLDVLRLVVSGVPDRDEMRTWLFMLRNAAGTSGSIELVQYLLEFDDVRPDEYAWMYTPALMYCQSTNIARLLLDDQRIPIPNDYFDHMSHEVMLMVFADQRFVVSPSVVESFAKKMGANKMRALLSLPGVTPTREALRVAARAKNMGALRVLQAALVGRKGVTPSEA